MDLEHERRLTEVEDRSKSNTRRIEVLEELQGTLNKMATSIETLALRENHVENDVAEIKVNVEKLNNKSGQKWDSLIDKIITVIVAALVGYILSKIGL